MIEVKNLDKSFGEKNVLKDISVTFETGKTNLIIGQSGSGKTVLLKSIVGLHKVDRGEVFYDSRNFTRMNETQVKAVRTEMGMLFQGSALFNSLTVEENVMFPLNMFTNKSLKEKLARVNFCLERVNIRNANHLTPAELSGGMQKRVGIARAIVLNPKYLFCDEPNSGLDPKTAIVIDKLISEITKEFNMTTIVNTHDMNSVMEIGEKIVFIYKGLKCWEGTKEEVLNTGNEHVDEFIFASTLAKSVRDLEQLKSESESEESE
jgi:phospholipid/cholesterol/gamma-HCH transport system ATP-binding protein